MPVSPIQQLQPFDLNWLEQLKLRIQNLAADPGGPARGWIYYNTTAEEYRGWNGTAWIALGGGGAHNHDAAYVNETDHTKVVHDALGIDAATLGGSTSSQLQTTITAAIVDTAPITLDTLNELAAALGDDPNFATTINNALAARVQSYDQTVGDGVAESIVVTHNLNTRKVGVWLYRTATPFDEVETRIERTTVNTITLVFSPTTIPTVGQYTVVVQGKPGA